MIGILLIPAILIPLAITKTILLVVEVWNDNIDSGVSRDSLYATYLHIVAYATLIMFSFIFNLTLYAYVGLVADTGLLVYAATLFSTIFPPLCLLYVAYKLYKDRKITNNLCNKNKWRDWHNQL